MSLLSVKVNEKAGACKLSVASAKYASTHEGYSSWATIRRNAP